MSNNNLKRAARIIAAVIGMVMLAAVNVFADAAVEPFYATGIGVGTIILIAIVVIITWVLIKKFFNKRK